MTSTLRNDSMSAARKRVPQGNPIPRGAFDVALRPAVVSPVRGASNVS